MSVCCFNVLLLELADVVVGCYVLVCLCTPICGLGESLFWLLYMSLPLLHYERVVDMDFILLKGLLGFYTFCTGLRIAGCVIAFVSGFDGFYDCATLRESPFEWGALLNGFWLLSGLDQRTLQCCDNSHCIPLIFKVLMDAFGCGFAVIQYMTVHVCTRYEQGVCFELIGYQSLLMDAYG
eukprot:gene13117-8963_t